jgi:hypothetical protein
MAVKGCTVWFSFDASFETVCDVAALVLSNYQKASIYTIAIV